MVDMYLDTFIGWVMSLTALAIFTFFMGACQPTTPKLLWSSLVFVVMLVVICLITPSQEKMIVMEYDDILKNRPACAEEVDKGLDSASMECLRVYKSYLEDSIDAAVMYKRHFEQLKSEIKR
jgi:hypothetical protein